MEKVLVSKTNLTNIADAIREKLNTDDTYKPSEMSDAIRSLSVDGVDPLWTADGKVYYQTLTFPDTVTSIGDYAYHNGGKIKKIILGDNITSIGKSAFYYCNIVEEIVFGSGLETIGETAFRMCGRSTLTKVDLMNTSLTSIGQNAFRNCEVLTDLLLPNTLTSTVVGITGSFATCDKLKNVTLQEGILCDLDFSVSVEFTTEDLVNMLNSLGTVPSGETKTFTIGVTNLAKLTDEQKLVATNKGWTLA